MRLSNAPCQAKNCTKDDRSTERVGNQPLTRPGPAGRSHLSSIFYKKSLSHANFFVVILAAPCYSLTMKDKNSQTIKAETFMERVMRLNKIAAEIAKKNLKEDNLNQ